MYWLLIIVTLALGLGSQAYINNTYKKWSKQRASDGRQGWQVAREMLDANGLSDVKIGQVSGHLTDNYDPRVKTLNLSSGVFDGTDVAALAVACHEAGHAVQHAKGYTPLKVRSALVPVVNFVSNAWIFVLLIGVLLNVAGLIDIAIIFYAVVVVFQLVMLPVEFDASKRALASLEGGVLVGEQAQGAHKVLRAAAFTYVASALASLLQLLYLLGAYRD